jgi:hypothetical protein
VSATHLSTTHAAPTRWPAALLALVVATLLCAATTMDDATVVFRLRDQFGRVHEAGEYRGRALVLVAAARGGRVVGTAWVEALRGLQDSVTPAGDVPVIAVADLRGVPWILRRFTRGQFPHDRRQPVLLDWDGSVARGLDLDRERCTVLVVGPDGHVETRVTPAVVDTLAARALLRAVADRWVGAGGRVRP